MRVSGTSTPGGDIANNRMPSEYSLSQNYPNPFNSTTIIKIGLPKQSSGAMEVYTVLGDNVGTLIQGETMGAGFYRLEWTVKPIEASRLRAVCICITFMLLRCRFQKRCCSSNNLFEYGIVLYVVAWGCC